MYEDEEREAIRGDGPAMPPDPWAGQFHTLHDAFERREPMRYVIDAIIQAGSLNIWYGFPSSFKSMLAADAAVAVAGGGSWLGRKVLQGPVLWIDCDNGLRRTHERFAALARARNLPEDTPLHYLSMPTPWLNAARLTDIEALERRIHERGIVLLVIDNLGLISPSAEENSADMITVMANLRLLVERTGAAIILIHHQRKSTGNGSRAGDSLRGHSSIEAAIDLALRVDRDPTDNLIMIQSTKTRDCDVPLFACQFRYDHLEGTGELWKAGFAQVITEDTSSDSAIERAILETLREHPGYNQKQVIEALRGELRGGVNRLRSIYNRMKDAGRLRYAEA
jgi:hypothetical protein